MLLTTIFSFHWIRLMIRGGPIITMSSSVLLYQCWPKKVNVYHFPALCRICTEFGLNT